MTTDTIEKQRANGKSERKPSAPKEPARYVSVSGFGGREFLVAGKGLRKGSTVDVETSSGKVNNVTIGDIVGNLHGRSLGTVARKS